MQQLELFPKELLSEPEAAAFLGLVYKHLRTLRHGTWQSPTPFREHDGVVYYRRTDLEAWAAKTTQKNAGHPTRQNLTSI